MTHRPLLFPGLLALVLLATVTVYWPGLHGPFVFDDDANLAILKPWLADQTGWLRVLFGVDSGPGGRPLSIASFMLSAWMGGLTPFAFKAGNLFLHLINGLLVYALARRLAPRDPCFAPHAPAVALVLATIWLLHPLLVSTVLYVVQRMAMLSTTFMLLGLWAYCHGRLKADDARPRSAFAWLFLVVPACTVLAAAAKENGLLLPFLCAVLEACYFRPLAGDKRPAVVRAFLWLGVALPLFAGIMLIAYKPAIILGGYESRNFTLVQRLLTEARILWDYVASTLLPYGPRMSLYRDDYLVSTSLLSPPSTVLALLGWLAATGVAWRLRRSIPAVAAGLGLFLVGHAMESTVIPLLLYFEHRNYLPILGILWAAGALLVSAASWLAPRMTNPRAVFGAGLALLMIGFAFATHGRAVVWAHAETLLMAQLKASPGSRWVRMEMALTALKKTPMDAATARTSYAALQAMPDPVSRQIGAQGQVVVDCALDGRVAPAKLDAMFAHHGKHIDPNQLQMLEVLGGVLKRAPCSGLPSGDFANRLAGWLEKTHAQEGSRVMNNLRFLAAQHYLIDSDPRAALEQAMLSWNAGARELALAAMIIDIHIALGQPQQAKQFLDATVPNIPPGDRRAAEVFDGLQEKLNLSKHSGKPPTPSTRHSGPP